MPQKQWGINSGKLTGKEHRAGLPIWQSSCAFGSQKPYEQVKKIKYACTGWADSSASILSTLARDDKEYGYSRIPEFLLCPRKPSASWKLTDP